MNVVKNIVTIEPSEDKQSAICNDRGMVSARGRGFAFHCSWFVLQIHQVKQNNIIPVRPAVVPAHDEEAASNLSRGMRKPPMREREIKTGPKESIKL